jgi:hypothetical protein
VTEYEQQADELQRHSEQVGDDIAEAREDWERKKADDSVPGAQNPETGLPPEANVTTQGDDPPDSPGSSELPPPEPDETD